MGFFDSIKKTLNVTGNLSEATKDLGPAGAKFIEEVTPEVRQTIKRIGQGSRIAGYGAGAASVVGAAASAAKAYRNRHNVPYTNFAMELKSLLGKSKRAIKRHPELKRLAAGAVGGLGVGASAAVAAKHINNTEIGD